jgi:hypothetical protein
MVVVLVICPKTGASLIACGSATKRFILTKLRFVPTDLLAKPGLSAGLADSCGEKTSVHVFRWATNGAKDASRGRATGFAGAQAQRPPRGQSYTP